MYFKFRFKNLYVTLNKNVRFLRFRNKYLESNFYLCWQTENKTCLVYVLGNA